MTPSEVAQEIRRSAKRGDHLVTPGGSMGYFVGVYGSFKLLWFCARKRDLEQECKIFDETYPVRLEDGSCIQGDKS
jgi:hypothetical protein